MNEVNKYGAISNPAISSQKDIVIKYKDKENFPPTPRLERIVLRAVAGILTFGASEIVLSSRDLLKVITGAILTSSLIGQLSSKERATDLKSFDDQKHPNITTKLEVTTADSAQLDGRIIDPKVAAVGEKKYVIWLNGLGESFESKLNDSVKYADSSGASLLVFNYRGAGNSKGLSSSGQDYVTDTLAMVSYLKSTGVKEENITIHGFSIGGGIGSNAAARLEKVKYINDRSFTSLSNASKEVIANETRHKIGDGAAKALGFFVSALVKHLDFDLNTKKIYTKPNPYAENSLESRTLIVFHPHDNVIKESSITGHSITKKPSLSGNVVDLTGGKELHDNQAMLKEMGNKLADYNIYQHEAYKDYFQSKGTKVTDSNYKNYLIEKIESALEIYSGGYDQKILNETLTELKSLTFSGEHVHGQFFLDFPVASTILNFVSSDQRFAKATPNNPTIDFSELGNFDINPF